MCNNNKVPQNNINKTDCCPVYDPDTDWCKAFNIRTQEQFKNSIDVAIDGMFFNINDAKNIIGQAEQYIAIIYELLIACIDQIMSVSSATSPTKYDYESVSVKIKEYLNEIYLIVGNSQYNGNHLLQDTTDVLRGIHDDNFQAGTTTYPNNYPQGCIPQAEITIPDNATITGGNTTIQFDLDLNVQNELDLYNYITTKLDVNILNTYRVKGDDINGEINMTSYTITTIGLLVVQIEFQLSAVTTIQPGSVIYITIVDTCVIDDTIITDQLVYNDSSERDKIHFRLAGPRGYCRTVDKVFNDFVYKLPAIGVHSLGLTSFTSKGGQDYYIDGLDAWTDDEGIIGPDSINDDDIDETVTDFNCAIKTIGVELDKMRSYRLVLCLREKQIKIYKNGLQRCLETKEKI